MTRTVPGARPAGRPGRSRALPTRAVRPWPPHPRFEIRIGIRVSPDCEAGMLVSSLRLTPRCARGQPFGCPNCSPPSMGFALPGPATPSKIVPDDFVVPDEFIEPYRFDDSHRPWCSPCGPPAAFARAPDARSPTPASIPPYAALQARAVVPGQGGSWLAPRRPVTQAESEASPVERRFMALLGIRDDEHVAH
jgi:hypothetical protein